MTKKSFIADCEDRADRLISLRLGYSRAQIGQLIKNGFAEVDGKPITKSSQKISLGSQITLNIPPPKEQLKEGSVDFDIEVIFEDEHILVINKPPGLVIHEAPSVKEATLVDWLKSKGYRLSTINGEFRAGIVHRLDKETSGVMVVAKTDIAHKSLTLQLKSRELGRIYTALIDFPLKESVTVDKPIARNPSNRLKMGVVNGGRESKSYFAKLLQSDNQKIELIAAKLHSGRTHQIRVHLAHLNRHILGDRLYGFKGDENIYKRVLLHSSYLHLNHPVSSRGMLFAGGLFDDYKDIIMKNFCKKDVDEKTAYSYINSIFDTF